MELAGEKTEKATPKRKQDERKKGNIFQSHEVVTVFSLIVVFYSFKFLAPYLMGALEKCVVDSISAASAVEELTPAQVRVDFWNAALIFAMTALPLLLISSLVGIVFSGIQTRFLVTPKLLAPKFNRLSPLQGFKKMFSMRGVVELLKSILKILVLGIVIYNVLSEELPLFPRMMDMSIQQVMATTGNIIIKIVQNAAIIFIFLAVADYAYQWWEYEKNLRMSKQDIKDEYKETEGDPQIKGKIKERQQQMARQRMMQNVPSADVVIRNPTHFAVAVKYEAGKNSAPVVIAKGADFLARKIVEIAEENKITIVENKPLARGLYAAVDLEQEIPEEFFKPVAEVLAYVYNLKEKERRGKLV